MPFAIKLFYGSIIYDKCNMAEIKPESIIPEETGQVLFEMRNSSIYSNL